MNQNYSIHLVWSSEDGAYIATVPELPGCKADGTTASAALEALNVIIEEWIETAKSLKRPVPPPMDTEAYDKTQKDWQERLQEYVKRETQEAVDRVMKQMAAYQPTAVGIDPADRWKLTDC